MPYSTRFICTRLLLLSALLFTAGLSACHKEAALPTTGAIESTILPAGQVLSITVTSAARQTYQVTPDAQTGAFSLAQLPAGEYTLTITPTAAYQTPAPLQLIVPAGGRLTPKLDDLRRNHVLRGTFTWFKDGVAYSATQLRGEVSSSFFSVEGALRTASAAHKLSLVIPGTFPQLPDSFHGVGTYRLGLADFPYAGYTYSPGTEDWLYFTLAGTGSTGSVTVTRFDEYTVAGTFALDAAPFSNPSGTPGNAKITQGSFELAY